MPVRRTLNVSLSPDLRRDLQEIADRECSYIGSIVRRACAFEVARIKHALAQRARRQREASDRA